VLAPGRSQKSLAEHRKIVAAIASSDRSAAERATRKHLTNVASKLADVATVAI
jgi:DNA-binding FadR family transcriptional regulator